MKRVRFFPFVLYFCVCTSALSQVDDVSPLTFEIELEGHTLRIPYYSNHDLYNQNKDLDKLIIVVQGNNRNAGPYLDNLMKAASKVSSTKNTLMVSPQFLIEEDIDFHNLSSEYLYWSSGGWKSGSNSKDENTNPRPVRIPSYEVLDRLLVHIANTFPSVKSLVFTGHSAGGQLTQRMAASSSIPDELCTSFGISTRFVPLNPSSYVYLDNQRRKADSDTAFETPNTTCLKYNEWKYGLDDLYTYPSRIGVDSIRKMYKRREIVYMVGEDDDDPNSSSLDLSCEGLLQGDQRLHRGEVFLNYLLHYYGDGIKESHEFKVVGGAGHNSLEMFDSFEGRNTLFINPVNNCSNIVNDVIETAMTDIMIYPNPAKETIIISSPSNTSLYGEYIIHSMDGRLIKSLRITSNSIDVSNLVKGLYNLTIKSEGLIINKSFLVE